MIPIRGPLDQGAPILIRHVCKKCGKVFFALQSNAPFCNPCRPKEKF